MPRSKIVVGLELERVEKIFTHSPNYNTLTSKAFG